MGEIEGCPKGKIEENRRLVHPNLIKKKMQPSDRTKFRAIFPDLPWEFKNMSKIQDTEDTYKIVILKLKHLWCVFTSKEKNCTTT